MHKSFRQTSENFKIEAFQQLSGQFPCKHYNGAFCHGLLPWKEEEVIKKYLIFNINSELCLYLIALY